jgi:hypothetical protein
MSKKKLEVVRGARGVDRKERLSRGGQQHVIARSAGVKASVTKDRKKEANKRACRGKRRNQ